MPTTKYDICLKEKHALISVYTKTEVKMYINVLMLLDKDLDDYEVKVYKMSDEFLWEYVNKFTSEIFV